jgi:hypothetical protein
MKTFTGHNPESLKILLRINLLKAFEVLFLTSSPDRGMAFFTLSGMTDHVKRFALVAWICFCHSRTNTLSFV